MCIEKNVFCCECMEINVQIYRSILIVCIKLYKYIENKLYKKIDCILDYLIGRVIIYVDRN